MKLEEVYSCARDCQLPGGGWSADRRAGRACGLIGLGPVVPRPTAIDLYQRVQGCPGGAPYIGRYPDKRLAGQSVLGVPLDPKHPFEDPIWGCPGAWYRTAYIDSLDPYTRRRTTDGGRVSNPRHDRATWQIQAAVRVLEDEEERHDAYVHNVINRRQTEELERQRNRNRGHGGAMGRRHR